MEKIRATAQQYLHQILAPVVHLLARSRLSPNQVSIAGFILALVAMVVLLAGYPFAAGVIFLLGSSFDILDGALARLEKKNTPFGALLDSTLDRISEGAILMAIAYHLALEGQAAAVAVVVLAQLGGMLTSYIRARAEVLGITCTIGWVSRPERVIIIGTGLSFDLLMEAAYLLAVLSLWTAGQRFFHVSTALHRHNP
ncbi:CDP-alcohol phosphatidyltransferase [Nitrosococcus watsonii C-113]|uniref:CDP-alcohol phosphatidyltransferase n=2 Tax=Nitrosococcus TaxID=1227 RepID=D8KC88_NITWC|nr:CDP-alcohol phosphatidyltransferase [Nitrosococcus watsonii C-113]